jgi:hypothetical protein
MLDVPIHKPFQIRSCKVTVKEMEIADFVVLINMHLYTIKSKVVLFYFYQHTVLAQIKFLLITLYTNSKVLYIS